MQARTDDDLVLVDEPADVAHVSTIDDIFEQVQQELQQLAAAEREVRDMLTWIRARLVRCERMLDILAHSTPVSGDRRVPPPIWREHSLVTLRLLTEQSCRDDSVAERGVEEGSPAIEMSPGRLTPRELDVLQLLASGKSNQEMAQLLCISKRTVERHIENLYRKIDARNRADATTFAFRHGLV